MTFHITDAHTQQANYLTQHQAKTGGASWCEGAADIGHPSHPATELVIDLIDRNPDNNLNPANYRALCQPAAQRMPSSFQN